MKKNIYTVGSTGTHHSQSPNRQGSDMLDIDGVEV